MKRITYSMDPIGFYSSVFGQKTGCPRQFGLINSRGKLRIEFGNNVHNSVDSLESFSHIYIIFIFHLNFHIQKQKEKEEEEEEDRVNLHVSKFNRMKATPPRLNKSVGVFSCRSPYRPNPIGISIGKINRILRGKNFVDIFLEGVDLIDGTPVLDIKPYISKYDAIPSVETRFPDWIKRSNFVNTIEEVIWTEQSILNLKNAMENLEFYEPHEFESVKSIIDKMILLEPRSAYRIEKNEKENECFCFFVDNLNVRCVYLRIDSNNENNNNESSTCYVYDVEDKKVAEKLTREERKKRNVEDANNFVRKILVEM